MSRRTDATSPSRRQRRRAGSAPTEFAAVDNQIHFHPDRRLGGFAILVLLRRSALRPAGVHLLEGATHRWWKAADVDDLPLGTWVRLRDEDGRALPVEVLRAARSVCVRWLGADGRPVEPSPWDRARSGAAQAVLAESPGPAAGFEVEWFTLPAGCPA